MHSELDEAFIEKADKTDLDDELPAAELRKAWREVNDKLTAAMEKLSAAEWSERHDSVWRRILRSSAGTELVGGAVEQDEPCGDA